MGMRKKKLGSGGIALIVDGRILMVSCVGFLLAVCIIKLMHKITKAWRAVEVHGVIFLLLESKVKIY